MHCSRHGRASSSASAPAASPARHASATSRTPGRSPRSSSPTDPDRRAEDRHAVVRPHAPAPPEPPLRADRPPAPRRAEEPREPSLGVPAAAPESAHRAPIEHLGPYAPLVDAIRDELDHFAASHVRLHLAIAERDRFLLTSIAVRSDGDADARRLLQRFCREFRPEQVKRFLAREVVAGLPNAGAIDLSRFEGLVDGDAARDAGAGGAADAGPYAELLAQLAVGTDDNGPDARAWHVDVLGRWIADADGPAVARFASPVRAAPAPHTPLAGLRQEFEVEDAAGHRRVVLQGVVPGRRYTVGTGEGADIRVDGIYASRRHAELWFEGARWHVADAGSTNGVRIESRSAVVDPTAGVDIVAPGATALLDPRGRLVLSARAEGPSSEYPTLALVAAGRAGSGPSPWLDVPTTPPTPISPSLSVAPTAALARTLEAEIDIPLGVRSDARLEAPAGVQPAAAAAPGDARADEPVDACAATVLDGRVAAPAESRVAEPAPPGVDVSLDGPVDPTLDSPESTALPALATVPCTPRTAVLPHPQALAADDAVDSLPPLPAGAFRLTVSQAGNIRTMDLDERALPVSIGRSRTCTIAVDRRHDSVSGRHLEILAIDDAGASVRVLGDNGLAIEAVRHEAGATVRWPWGAIAELAVPGGAPAPARCSSRAPGRHDEHDPRDGPAHADRAVGARRHVAAAARRWRAGDAVGG
jgi:pSer/pThr/pTyr-binding forkhead associated (FHA) protein